MVSTLIFELLCRLDELIDRKPHLPDEEREELIFQRDCMIADNPDTARFREMTIHDFMRKKK